jgi:anti-anti-sigma regulatory factor
MNAVNPDTEAASHHHHTTVIDCRGARLRSHTDTGLTVIAISGEIDASNVDALCRRAPGLVPHRGALIVDLAGIDFIAVDALRALFALNTHCARIDTTWALIASHAANRLLQVGDRDKLLPTVGSATEALLLVRRSRRPPIATARQFAQLAARREGFCPSAVLRRCVGDGEF